MAATLDRATLDRLIALGRARGGLTPADLQAALPVEAMEVDALVLVMLELEAAGVSVEPDAVGPRADTDAAPRLVLPTPEPGLARTIATTAGSRPLGDDPAAPSPAASRPGEAADDLVVGRIILGAGLAVLLVLGTILILI